MDVIVLCIGIILIIFNHSVMKDHRQWEQRQREDNLRQSIYNRTYKPATPHESPDAESGLENYSGEFNKEFEEKQ